MSTMETFGNYDDSSGNVEVSISQSSNVYDSQSSVSEYFNQANLPSSQTSLSQDLNQADGDSGVDFLSDFVDKHGGIQDCQAWLDPINSNPGGNVWTPEVIASDRSKRKRENPQNGDSPYLYSGRTTGADNSEENSGRHRKLQNREYSKNSRKRIKDKIKNLEEMTVTLECVAEIYRKALTVLFKRWRKDNNLEWVSRKISWHTSSHTGNEECKEVECLLPNIDDKFMEELGNASCGTILNSTNPPELVVGNQPSSGDKQHVPFFNKTNVVIDNSPEVVHVSADVDGDLNVGIQQDTFRLHTDPTSDIRGVDSVRSLDVSLAQTPPESSLQDVPSTSSDPGRTRRISLGNSQLIGFPTTTQNISGTYKVSFASALVQPDGLSSIQAVPRFFYIISGSNGGHAGQVPVSTLPSRTNTPVEQQGPYGRTFNSRTFKEQYRSLKSLSNGREPDVDDISSLNASLDVV